MLVTFNIHSCVVVCVLLFLLLAQRSCFFDHSLLETWCLIFLLFILCLLKRGSTAVQNKGHCFLLDFFFLFGKVNKV